MGWFKRIKGGITTSTHEKKETPDGLWSKCPKCKTIITTEEHKKNLQVCVNCNYHSRIKSSEYFGNQCIVVAVDAKKINNDWYN